MAADELDLLGHRARLEQRGQFMRLVEKTHRPEQEFPPGRRQFDIAAATARFLVQADAEGAFQRKNAAAQSLRGNILAAGSQLQTPEPGQFDKRGDLFGGQRREFSSHTQTCQELTHYPEIPVSCKAISA